MKENSKENNLYKVLLKVLSIQNDTKLSSNNTVCFMLHDEVLNESHKIELDEFYEWHTDGSFEKKDKLYLSILLKEF